MSIWARSWDFASGSAGCILGFAVRMLSTSAGLHPADTGIDLVRRSLLSQRIVGGLRSTWSDWTTGPSTPFKSTIVRFFSPDEFLVTKRNRGEISTVRDELARFREHFLSAIVPVSKPDATGGSAILVYGNLTNMVLVHHPSGPVWPRL